MYQYQVPKKHRSYYILITLMAGLVLIGSGVYLEYRQLSIYVWGFVLAYRIISLFLMVLGASALVVCLTSSLLLKEIKGKLNDMLEKKLDKSQQVQVRFLKHSFSVTGQALAYKLEDILPPRYRLVVGDNGQRSIEPNFQTFEKIAGHIQSYVKNFISHPMDKGQKDRIILINGITLKDLVDPGNPLSNSITSAVKELSYESRKRSIGNRQLVIRALMLSPHCDAVNLRRTLKQSNPQTPAINEEVESFFQHYALQDQTRSADQSVEGRLQGDIEYSIRAFKNLAHIIETKHSAVKLELKQTVVLPPAYFIITEEFIFIEQYHLGRESLNGNYKCLVGTVPMLQFAAGSPVYNNMRKHFEFLWGIESNKELNRLFRVEKLT